MMRRLCAGAVVAFALVRPAFAGDVKVDCIAAADQAQQARDDGKYRAARDGFASCARAVCPKMVSASCTKWLRETQEGMPTVVLSAKDATGADITDARVMFDGAALVSSLDGRPVEVDPGAHKLRFEREGSEPAEQSVVIKAGDKLRSISVTLRASAPTTTHDEHPAEKSPEKPGAGGARIATAVTFGVLAVGAFAGGIGFALSSQGDASTADGIRKTMATNACIGAGGTSMPCQSLSNAVDAQNRDGTIGIALYVTSAVLATAAVVTWLAWPKPKTENNPTAHLLLGPTFAGIGGTF